MTNIVIVSIEEPIYLFSFWSSICKHLKGQVKKIYVVKPTSKSVKGYIHDFIYKSLLALTIYEIRDIFNIILTYSFAKLKNEKSPFSLFSIASDFKIPIDTISSVNSIKFQDDIVKLSCDIILAQVPMLVKKESLNIPKLGWINKHFGLLPEYRGAFPFLWAYWRNEPIIGVSIHFMNERLDEGDIIGQNKIFRRDNDTIPSVLRSLNRKAAKLMVECIKNLGQIKYQGGKKGHYYKEPSMFKLVSHILNEWKRYIFRKFSEDT